MKKRSPLPLHPRLSRRDFCRLMGAGAMTIGSIPLIGCGSDGGNNSPYSGDGDTELPGGDLDSMEAESQRKKFRFAVIADTHVIDDHYLEFEGPESNQLDTESMLHTNERMTSVKDFMNALDPAMDMVFIAGDVVHNYPSTEWDYYFENETRFDIAKQIMDLFSMPIYPGLGNHDYDVPSVSRDFTHDLVKDKWGIDPYYSLDFEGWKFVHLNNFLGETWNPDSEDYADDVGSFGEEQLNWLDAELSEGKPTFLFTHYMPLILKQKEVEDLDIFSVIDRHDNMQFMFVGHTHRWMDFSTINAFNFPHMVLASTRYDDSAYLLVEVDMVEQTFQFLNIDLLEWGTHYSEPYEG